MNEKPIAVAVLTPDEMASFTRVRDELRALDETANSLIKAAMRDLAEKRRALLTEHRVGWEAVEKKYGLDSRKSYELVHSTGELIEHNCTMHGGAVVINLSELAQSAAQAVTGIHGEVKPVDKKDLN